MRSLLPDCGVSNTTARGFASDPHRLNRCLTPRCQTPFRRRGRSTDGYALYSPTSSAACGLPTCPASRRIAGTSGSETKFFQPAASQSKSTQTLFSSDGSRKTVEPLEPCCCRFSAPLVEKISRKRSTSTTFVVARSNLFPPLVSSAPGSPPSVDEHTPEILGVQSLPLTTW